MIYSQFRYNGKLITVERTREQQTMDLTLGIPWETVKLTALGRDKSIYFTILEEGNEKILSQRRLILIL